MARRQFTPLPLVLRELTVLRTDPVTPRMRRVTLGGPEFGAFERDGLQLPGFTSLAFDDHIKLIFATEGPVDRVLPIQLAHGIEWTPAPARVTRDYTPRRVTDSELDLDFVLHAAPDSRDTGIAEAWARDAQPGDRLWIVGPKSATILPEPIDRIILLGDETALPAIGRYLDDPPLPVPVHALVTIADPSARQELPDQPLDHDVHWVIAEPGDGAALEQAVAGLDPEMFAGAAYVWAAAEARALLPVRQLLGRTRIPRSHLDITGYWHTTRPAAETKPVGAAAGPQRGAAAPIESPVAWFAVRAALQLGLLDALGSTAIAVPDLEQRLELPAGSLDPLLAVLAARALVDITESSVRLSEAGLELVTDEHGRESFDGFGAEQVLALTELAPALRAGVPAWRHRHGRTLTEAAAEQPELAEELADHAGGLAYLMPALLAAQPWPEGATLAVHGPGAEVVGAALHEGATAGRWQLTTDQPADVGIPVLALAHRTDEEARRLLTDQLRHSPRLALIESTRPDALNPRVAEEGLLRLASTGSGPRTLERLQELAGEAGWSADEVHELGWGMACLTFTAIDAR